MNKSRGGRFDEPEKERSWNRITASIPKELKDKLDNSLTRHGEKSAFIADAIKSRLNLFDESSNKRRDFAETARKLKVFNDSLQAMADDLEAGRSYFAPGKEQFYNKAIENSLFMLCFMATDSVIKGKGDFYASKRAEVIELLVELTELTEDEAVNIVDRSVEQHLEAFPDSARKRPFFSRVKSFFR